MSPEIREAFDQQLEIVLPELPQQVRSFMNDVPLVVEDYPSDEIMRRMRVRHRSSCAVCTRAFRSLSGASTTRACRRT